MSEIKLPRLPDRTPVRISLNLQPDLHRLLGDYAAFYEAHHGEPVAIQDLVPAMLASFLQSDRAFQKAVRDRREGKAPNGEGASGRGAAP